MKAFSNRPDSVNWQRSRKIRWINLKNRVPNTFLSNERVDFSKSFSLFSQFCVSRWIGLSSKWICHSFHTLWRNARYVSVYRTYKNHQYLPISPPIYSHPSNFRDMNIKQHQTSLYVLLDEIPNKLMQFSKSSSKIYIIRNTVQTFAGDLRIWWNNKFQTSTLMPITSLGTQISDRNLPTASFVRLVDTIINIQVSILSKYT